MSIINKTFFCNRHSLIKSFLIIFVIILSASIFHLVAVDFIKKRSHVEFCMNFVSQNSSVREYFGNIKHIKICINGYKKNNNSGTVPFIIIGEKHKDKIKVKWKGDSGQFSIVKITTRACLMKELVIFPKGETKKISCFLVYNYWDGLINIGISFLILMFYFDCKRKRVICKIFYGLFMKDEKSYEKLCYIFGITFIISIILSILIFFKIIII